MQKIPKTGVRTTLLPDIDIISEFLLSIVESLGRNDDVHPLLMTANRPALWGVAFQAAHSSA